MDSPVMPVRPSKSRLSLTSGDGLRLSSCKALASIIGDRPVNNRAAVNTFPCVENEEKIGEPFQHHKPFALWTFHHSLLR